jgi:PmbA protein
MHAVVDESRIPELKEVVRLALAEAQRRGASECAVDASLNQGISAGVRLGEVETVEYQRDRGLGITVYFGKQKGSASTADLAAGAVRAMVEKACSVARHTAADECAGLPDADTLARDIPDLDLDHPWSLTPDHAIELALACEAAGLAVDARLTNSEGASVTSQRDLRVHGNSLGFLAGYSSTSHSVSCVLLAEEDGDMQRDYWYSTARAREDLEAVESIGRHAGERAVARLKGRKLSTRHAPVLFAPEMARGLFAHFLGAIRGSSQYRRSSFLLDAAGTRVFPEFIAMHERPHVPKALASSPFDDEGVATRDRELVREGILAGYVLGTYSARKLGLKTTGNAGGVHNLTVASTRPAPSFTGLLERMGTGLLITELMGQGVNAVTGDYSRGASGFWVEQGALAYPVHEITVAGNLRTMYQQILAVGADVDRRGGLHTGSLLIEDMTIAGD